MRYFTKGINKQTNKQTRIKIDVSISIINPPWLAGDNELNTKFRILRT